MLFRSSGVAERKPLLHFWSLSIEEQYYLVLPLLLLALTWRAKSALAAWHRCHGALLLGCGLSLGFCLWLAPRHGAAAFYLLPTRAWELMAGVLVALASRSRWSGLPTAVREGSAALGLAAVVFSVGGAGVIDQQFPAMRALPATLGAALLIAAGGQTLAARVLALRPLVAVGVISYSVYLWHQPLFAFAHAFALSYTLGSADAIEIGRAHV